MGDILTLIHNLERRVDIIAERINSLNGASEDSFSKADLKTGKIKLENRENKTLLEEALCDIDTAASDRLADLEEALCELSEIMEEGGNGNG